MNKVQRFKGSKVHGFKVQGFKIAALLIALVVAAAATALGAADPWREATKGYEFAFPRDHASHPDYKIEWWYYTGNVTAADGRRFGYQVTFFRVGIDHAPTNPSRWSVRDLFMTHLAVSDVTGQRYRYVERLSRGGPGLAGGATDRYRVWNEDWTASLDERGHHVLRALDEKAGVDLVLEPGKPPVVNGLDGISQKGERVGNASHYYSLTRMPTRGAITIDGQRVEVSGESWMDHEFGTTFLEPEQRGWDWLSIQLADGRELMLYQLRRADGSRDPRSSGTLIERDGRATHLSLSDFTLSAGARNFRARNGAVYPLTWTVAVPSKQLELHVTTPLANQELALERSSGVAYWEGLIDVAGTEAGRALSGRGYLEMTGYHASLGRILTSQ
jgi:predicted secreted hydrolase